MSFNEIKRVIHEKYPGKYTDEEIENLPIIIGNDVEFLASNIEPEMISIINNGYYMNHNFNEKILVIEAW